MLAQQQGRAERRQIQRIHNNKQQKRKGKQKQKIETLSAAAAAQNLAVFLKSRSMTENPYNKALMKEAKSLYNQVEKVRTQLLPKQHPDLYATKYSLAELLEVIGDTEAANQLRQEIIDTYDPPSEEEEEKDGRGQADSREPGAGSGESGEQRTASSQAAARAGA